MVLPASLEINDKKEEGCQNGRTCPPTAALGLSEGHTLAIHTLGRWRLHVIIGKRNISRLPDSSECNARRQSYSLGEDSFRDFKFMFIYL